MSTAPVAPPPTSSSGGGPAAVLATIVGALLALTGALAVLVAFGLAVAQLTLRDDDGYYTSPRAHLTTPTAAIVGESLSLGDVDGGSGADVVDALSVKARISATARDGGAVFVGIGPTAAVQRYLAGAPHAETDGIHDGDVVLRTHPGTRRLAPPGTERFWVVSAQGPGRQQVTWKPTSGDWSAVVMNADGARGVDLDVRVGARIGALPWIAAGIGVVGLLLLIGGGVLMVVGLRPRPTHAEPATTETEAAAPDRHPVVVEARLDEPLSRWLWLVKWILVIPHLICLAVLWAAFAGVTIVAWFAIVFTGRYPRALFDFNVGVLRWTWRVELYANGAFATDRYPPFSLHDDPSHPARLEIPYPAQLSRGKVWVKTWLLAIPHYLVLAAFWGAWPAWASTDWRAPGLLVILIVIAVIALAVTGRYPRDLFRLIVGVHRWTLRVIAYAALMRDEYPPFRLEDDRDTSAA